MVDALLRRLWDEFGRRSSGTNEWVGKGFSELRNDCSKARDGGLSERAGVGSEVTHDG